MANSSKKGVPGSLKGRAWKNEYRRLVLKRATEALLCRKVANIEYPGGKNRESLRMLLDDANSVIATRRATVKRARVEAQTLRTLNKHNAPAPRLLASNHSQILIQEEIRGERLSHALKDADEQRLTSLLSSALSALRQSIARPPPKT